MYLSPQTVEHAVAQMAEKKCTVLSGGTDFYPALAEGQASGNILDVSQLQGLKEITKREDGSWSIGCCVTWTDVIKKDLPSAFDGLKLAAREVGSIQIQNRATVVGNLCNASPAADGVPPLLTLNAIVEIASKSGQRNVPLAEFIIGNRKIDLHNGELVTGLIIPADSAQGLSGFLKLGARKYLVISIAMVAVRLKMDQNKTILDAAISVGSCSVVARRLTSLEKTLIGKSLNGESQNLVNASHLKDLSPIDDVRATGTYRMDASLELIRRALSMVQQSA